MIDMGNYHNDQPITGTNDAPDRLNRESFAEHLSEILVLNPGDDCLTVSLEGEWGYGKTSVINLVKKHCVQHSLKPVIIEYNPWLSGKAEALIQDFLVQFSSQLNIPDRPKEGLKAAKELLAYSKLFNAMKFIPGAEPWASTVEGVFKIFGGATEKISKLKELDLLDRKKKVKEVLASLNQSIIVIIDDIDRLTPDEAFQIVRLIKAVADFPGTSFLLAFDPEYLTGALERHGINKSDQYIDKIVQLRVPLPLITHKDMQILADIELKNLSTKNLTERFDEDQERLALLYHQHIKYVIRTPRELKRLFNHLRFVLKQTEDEVSFTDLYSLSLLMIKAPVVYQHIKDTPAAYVGRNFDEELVMEKPEEIVKQHEESRIKPLDSVAQKDRGHINEILKDLFPLIENSEYGTRGSEYDKLGRIASPKRLYIALHYQIPTGYAADTDIALFISGDIDRHDYLKRSIDDDFIERFFELLSQNINKVDENNILGILKAIYDVFLPSEYLQVHEESKMSFFGFDPFRNIRWVTIDLIRKSENKPELILQLLKTKDYIYITVDIIRRLLVQYGEIETTELSDKDEHWLDEAVYKEVKKIWVASVIDIIREGTIFNSVYASHVCFTLMHADKKKTQELFSDILSQEGGIEKIAQLIGRSGTDSTNGAYSLIKQGDFDEFIDFYELQMAAKMELESNTKLTPYLNAVYKSIVLGDKYYLNDATKDEEF